MTHHSVMTSSLVIKNLRFGIFDDFSSDIDFISNMDVFRDAISLIIKNVISGDRRELPRTQSVRQPRSASKRSALVYTYTHTH